MSVMMMQAISRLKPNLTTADLQEIADSSDGYLHMVGGKIELSAIKAGMELVHNSPFRLTYDTEDCIIEVTFLSSFPLSIYGLKFGMPIAEAQSTLPAAPVQIKPLSDQELAKLGENYTEELIKKLVRDRNNFRKFRAILPESAIELHYGERDGQIASISLRSLDYETKLKQSIEQEQAAKTKWLQQQELQSLWKRVGDPDEMLRTWARHHTSWANEQKGKWSVLADWLIDDATAEDRHIFSHSFNWDHGIPPILWLIRQSDTDLATVIHIFQLAASCVPMENFLDPDKATHTYRQPLDLALEIKEKVERKFYVNANFSYNQSTFSIFEPKNYQIAKRVFPKQCLSSFSGKTVSLETQPYRVPIEVS